MSSDCSCDCRPRTRHSIRPGSTTTASPTDSSPSSSVPVTTAPKPEIENDRSIGSLGLPWLGIGGRSLSSRSISVRSCSMPSPVRAETGAIVEPARAVWANSSSISSSTRAIHSSSTRSVLVSATRPRSMSSRSRMSRCSRVWGMTPSSAAMTSRARLMPPTPASMFLMKRSWPGTSTMLTARPEGSSHQAKPRSMVRPRAFSSAQRSGSMPESAWTRALLPWSTCPAVPMTYTRLP